MASFSFNNFINTLDRKLEPQIQLHLKQVYTSMAIALLSASLGGYIHLFTSILQGGILSALAAIGFAVALMATPDSGKNTNLRMGYLIGFSFATGLGLGPLLDFVMMVDPSIIPTAFLSTCFIFSCFSLSAMFSDHRKWIYLGGTLMSLMSVMLLVSIMNLFIGSRLVFQAQLYIGLFLVCGFIMYDTSLIIEKRKRGDTDYIWHTVLLFIDFIEVFRYLVIILTQKEQRKQKKQK